MKKLAMLVGCGLVAFAIGCSAETPAPSPTIPNPAGMAGSATDAKAKMDADAAADPAAEKKDDAATEKKDDAAAEKKDDAATEKKDEAATEKKE